MWIIFNNCDLKKWLIKVQYHFLISWALHEMEQQAEAYSLDLSNWVWRLASGGDSGEHLTLSTACIARPCRRESSTSESLQDPSGFKPKRQFKLFCVIFPWKVAGAQQQNSCGCRPVSWQPCFWHRVQSHPLLSLNGRSQSVRWGAALGIIGYPPPGRK